METSKICFFPNFIREMEKIKNQKRTILKTNNEDIPDVYVNYVTHVNTINGFKSNMAGTTLVDAVTKLLKAGETVQITADCIEAINLKWAEWGNCYVQLVDGYHDTTRDLGRVKTEITDAIMWLQELCKDNAATDPKTNLLNDISYMIIYLNRALGVTSNTIKIVSTFHDTYDVQTDNFNKIVTQLRNCFDFIR